MTARTLPVIALTFGDPAGIGPEIVAKLAARTELMRQARAVVSGDRWVWEEANVEARSRAFAIACRMGAAADGQV